MTEQEAKIKELELRVKKLEDKVFDQWLSQYDTYPNVTVDFEHNYIYPPTQGCNIYNEDGTLKDEYLPRS